MLRHWILLEHIDWPQLCTNRSPHAIHLLSLPENFHRIDWNLLSANPSAADLLLKYPEKIVWKSLCLNTNPKIVALLLRAFQERDFKKLCWIRICRNDCPDIIPLLEYAVEHFYEMDDTGELFFQLSANPVATPLFLCSKHYDKISWQGMCINTSQEAIALLSKPENFYRLHMNSLCLNPSASDLLLKEFKYNPHNIWWNSLVFNTNPKIVKIFENNLDKFHWYMLTGNKSIEAFKIIEKNTDYISWNMLLDNPHALELVYELTGGNITGYSWKPLSQNPAIFLEWSDIPERPFKEELMAVALSPERVSAIKKQQGKLDGYI